eukprot:gnl/Dysnectes_brevis/178_a206_5807.p1 GENE.gnl/Dysnectes_brevis/178_a206_5807~~gnl/Dysnectes_brevis/178_a206_5807.p1  ORF type:complete len:262 (-),score=92.45 gnl/Dysnectes_brevis/178_a206_5807:110-895(-)
MSLPVINIDSCIGCGKCVKVCPSRVIKLVDSKATLASPKRCIGCGHCAASCPVGAISMFDVTPEKVEISSKTIVEDFKALTQMRHSIRAYQPEPLPREEIQEILDVTAACPSACNFRPVHFTVLGREFLDTIGIEIATAIPEDHPFKAMFNAQLKGRDILFRGAPHVVLVHAPKNPSYDPAEDCCIAATTLELYATAKGLGSLWVGFMTSALGMMPEIALKCGVPLDHTTVCCLALGKIDTAKESYTRSAVRKPYPTKYID